MDRFQPFDAALLDAAGLNRQAVFRFGDLPADVAQSICAACPGAGPDSQLILIGHAGRTLWECVTAAGIDSNDPIDDFTVKTVTAWFAQCHPGNVFDILYPGPHMIGLQRLGQLAGWHHATPFMVGIDARWGTWFAYRAVVVADTRFAPTERCEGEHPCMHCAHKTCIDHCPAGALAGGQFDFGKCIAYRKSGGSACRDTCVARISCPVGSEHRYRDEQIRHSYSNSMRAIEKYY